LQVLSSKTGGTAAKVEVANVDMSLRRSKPAAGAPLTKNMPMKNGNAARRPGVLPRNRVATMNPKLRSTIGDTGRQSHDAAARRRNAQDRAR
jgi:hypothetical protein